MKKNEIIIYLILLFTLIFSVTVHGLAGVTLQEPADDTIIQGTDLTVVNITWSDLTADTINCQLHVLSLNTSNSTGYDLFNISNATSGNNNSANTTINFSLILFEDSDDYNLTVYCQNQTEAKDGDNDTSTGILMDHTTPTTPSSLTPSNKSVHTSRAVTFNVTVGGTNTNYCTIYFPSNNPGSYAYNMTYNGNYCAYTFSSFGSNAQYDWYVVASDKTNTTNSSTLTLYYSAISIGGGGSGGGGSSEPVYVYQEKKEETTTQTTATTSEGASIGGFFQFIKDIFSSLFNIFKK